MAKQKKKLKPGECYYIEWLDAYAGPNVWQSHDDIEEMCNDYVVWTLGWLQKETDKYYIFASTVAKSAAADAKSAVWAIPKGMIINVRNVAFDD